MKNKQILKIGTIILLGIGSLSAQDAVSSEENNASSSHEVIIKIPKVPEVPKVEAVVPKVIVLDDNNNSITIQEIRKARREKNKVVFSDHVAPERFAIKQKKIEDEGLPGDVKNGRVTAYLHAPLMSVEEVKENLKKAGFEILATYGIDKKASATSIVFSNKAMEKAASKNMRGFAGTLRVTVDNNNKLTSISNPIYAMGAFMQQDYDKELAQETLNQLRAVFTDVKNSQEMIKFNALERFRFMENMPYYQDMEVISKGKNDELLKKAKDSKQIVYEQHLEGGSIVVGVELSKRTSKFVKKTGYENSGLLPYPVLIENGEAKIMAPQYYIAVMYPMLKMSQFMTIATTPGAISKDIDKIFR